MVRTMLASARKEEAELRAHEAKRLKTFEAMETLGAGVFHPFSLFFHRFSTSLSMVLKRNCM